MKRNTMCYRYNKIDMNGRHCNSGIYYVCNTKKIRVLQGIASCLGNRDDVFIYELKCHNN